MCLPSSLAAFHNGTYVQSHLLRFSENCILLLNGQMNGLLLIPIDILYQRWYELSLLYDLFVNAGLEYNHNM